MSLLPIGVGCIITAYNSNLISESIIPSPACGETDENLNHLTWQHKLFNFERQKLIRSLSNINFQLLLQAEIILAQPNSLACKLLFQSYEECNKFRKRKTLYLNTKMEILQQKHLYKNRIVNIVK